MSKHVKIEKAWDSLASQSVTDDDGNTWLISELVEHASSLPVMKVPMKHLSMSGGIAGSTLRDFVAHMQQVLDADLEYPIILDQDGGIFDGRHRLAKALLEKRSHIKAVRFDHDPRPSIFGGKDKD